MKKLQLLSILALSGTVLFGGTIKTTKAKVNFQQSTLERSQSTNAVAADLVIDSNQSVKGLQSDITFNTEEIKSITPQPISDFEVEFNELSDGVLRVLIFSLSGAEFSENPTFEFEFVDGFTGTSTIEFQEIILADSDGKSIDVEAQSYTLDRSNTLFPIKTELTDAYPNPFNPSSTINYGLANDGFVEIMIYDATGRLVEELVNQNQVAGYYNVTWNASNQASGMYFAKMVAGDVVQTQKLVLLK